VIERPSLAVVSISEPLWVDRRDFSAVVRQISLEPFLGKFKLHSINPSRIRPGSRCQNEAVCQRTPALSSGPTFNEGVRARQFSNGTSGFYLSGRVELSLPDGKAAVMLGSLILMAVFLNDPNEQS
jgi:hypothetical protein